MFYFWLSVGITIVNKELLKKCLDLDLDNPGTLDLDYDPDRHRNLIDWSLGHASRLQKISSKSVYNFFQ